MDEVSGRLFLDFDGSRTLTAGDVPMEFVPIVLLQSGAQGRASGSPLATTTTNATGHFVFRGNFPGSLQLVIADDATRRMFFSLSTGADGKPPVQPGDIAVAPLTTCTVTTEAQGLSSSTLSVTPSTSSSKVSWAALDVGRPNLN